MSATSDYRMTLGADPCAYCGEPAEQIDHVEPRALGGGDAPSNLTAACGSCNAAKRDTPLLFFLLHRADPSVPVVRGPRVPKTRPTGRGMVGAQYLRLEARLSVAQLAKECEVSRASITRLEQTGEAGSHHVLTQLAEHFKVDTSELLLPVGVVPKEAA